MLIQHELVHEPQGTHAPWRRIYITALAAMCHSSFGCLRYCCFTDQVLRLRQETTRTSATLSVARTAGHARDGSRQPTTTEARCEEDHMRLPRNDARCKLETRDLPTHCPAERPKKHLFDGSRTDRRKREHAQLCELARTSPEVSNSCHCNSAIEISKHRRADALQ